MKRHASRRSDAEYWQRLRRDRRSNAAAILAAAAALFGTLGVVAVLLDGPHAPHASLFSWLLMLPMAWWVGDLTRFTARAVRLWTTAMLLSIAGASFGLLGAITRSDDSLIPLLNFSLAILAAVASLALRRGSLVEREGPAR
ncbi:hypothetical protein [Aureimonas ureilytica]|uniref:hypothetical protein n=1 Tax=Aureimonas ureilytica TaxID=401562 RepID=UPI000365BC67|nr:hypothetical protein [Aureimonas ureilytica]